MTETQKGFEVKDRRVSVVESAPPAVQDSPNAVLITAMQKNYSPELIKQMMDLQERFEKNEARKAYVKAMAAFKSNPPEILKTKHVSYVNNKNQTVEWDHAVLGEITEAVIKGMSPHGLYHRWDMTQPDANTVKTTCIITHELGHSEQTSMSGPPDTNGGKDALKAVASTNTLLQRLTLLSLTGLAAKGLDNKSPNSDKGPSPFEQWEIKAQEVFEAATKLEDMIQFWPDNGPTIKKELNKADAAKIYDMFVKRKKELTVAEREPGSDDK